MNDKEVVIELKPYRVNLRLKITDNAQEIFKNLYGEYKPGCQAVTDYFPEKREALIILPINRKHGIIAHESLHAVMMIFMALGVKVSVDNDEHATYLLEHIVDVIEKAYDDYLVENDI